MGVLRTLTELKLKITYKLKSIAKLNRESLTLLESFEAHLKIDGTSIWSSQKMMASLNFSEVS